MEILLLIKLLFYTAILQSPVTQCFSIKDEKFFKECFFSFKPENWLLKDNDLICAVKEIVHSLAEAFLPAAHSKI